MVANEEIGTFTNILRDALRARGYSVERLAKETGISDRFLSLMLEERYGELPPSPYVHGYIVRIGKVLDFDGEEMWQMYFREKKDIKKSGERDKLPPNRFLLKRVHVSALVAALLLAGIAVYFFVSSYRSADITKALSIMDLGGETTVVTTSTLRVAGTVSGNATLTINGSAVYPDINGAFTHTLNLSPGMNAVVFEVRGMLGRTGEVTRYVFFRTAEEGTSTSTSTINETAPKG